MMPPYSLISVMMADMMMSASLMMMDDEGWYILGTSPARAGGGRNHSNIEKRNNKSVYVIQPSSSACYLSFRFGTVPPILAVLSCHHPDVAVIPRQRRR